MRSVKKPIPLHSHPSTIRLTNILFRALGRALTAASLGWIILLTACSPPAFFLESIESKDVRIQDDRILGLWVMTDSEEDFEEVAPVEVRVGRRGSYTIIAPGIYVFDEDEDNVYTFTGHLVSLGGRTYIDMVQTEIAYKEGHKLSDLPETLLMHLVPMHVVGRLHLDDNTASLELLDSEWLSEYLEDHPGALEYYDEPALVTSGKETIQAFLIERGNEWKAWDESWVFTRPEPSGKDPDYAFTPILNGQVYKTLLECATIQAEASEPDYIPSSSKNGSGEKVSDKDVDFYKVCDSEFLPYEGNVSVLVVGVDEFNLHNKLQIGTVEIKKKGKKGELLEAMTIAAARNGADTIILWWEEPHVVAKSQFYWSARAYRTR